MPMQVTAAHTAQVVQGGIDTMATAEDVVREVERLGKLAENAKQYRTAIQAQRERARGAELVAKLRGELASSDGPLHDPRWFRLREAIYEVLAPYPDIMAALQARLIGVARPPRQLSVPAPVVTVEPEETDEPNTDGDD